MSQHGPSFDQRSFIAELDDVAAMLKRTLAGHDGHEGWTLRSTGVLTCSCGQSLYAPEVPAEPPADPSPTAGRHGQDDPGGDLRQVVVVPPEEIDVATADAFSRDLSQAFATGPDRLVIDFARTTFCDSTALRVLVNAARQASSSGCRLVLVNAPRQLLLMAEILGASPVLGLPPSPA